MGVAIYAVVFIFKHWPFKALIGALKPGFFHVESICEMKASFLEADDVKCRHWFVRWKVIYSEVYRSDSAGGIPAQITCQKMSSRKYLAEGDFFCLFQFAK